MEKLSNLDIGLMASTLLFAILYVREKLKPKTEAEILYAKEKQRERERELGKKEDLRLSKIAEIKRLDDDFKNLKKPVLFNAYHFNQKSEFSDEMSLTLNVTNGDDESKAFTISGEVEFLRKNAPFFMSIWQTRIAQDNFKKLSLGDKLF